MNFLAVVIGLVLLWIVVHHVEFKSEDKDLESNQGNNDTQDIRRHQSSSDSIAQYLSYIIRDNHVTDSLHNPSSYNLEKPQASLEIRDPVTEEILKLLKDKVS
jgi:hypothetical protein